MAKDAETFGALFACEQEYRETDCRRSWSTNNHDGDD
jgi:hypothetical protein